MRAASILAAWAVLGWGALAAASAPALGAQQVSLAQGDWVRIRGSAPGAEWLEGEIVSLDDRSLELRSPDGRPTTWPVSGIAELEVSRGERKRILEGALLGLGTGVALRLLIREPRESEDRSVGSALLLSKTRTGVVFAATGLGALTGYHWRVHRWEPLLGAWAVGVTADGAGRWGLALGLGL